MADLDSFRAEVGEWLDANAPQSLRGVQVTDEHDIGFYMKRARVAATTFGDAAWHRDRWVCLSGY